MYDLNRRFLICFDVTVVPMILIVGVSLLHIFWCNILEDQEGLGIQGLGIASTVTCLLAFVSTFININMARETCIAISWPGPSILNG